MKIPILTETGDFGVKGGPYWCHAKFFFWQNNGRHKKGWF